MLKDKTLFALAFTIFSIFASALVTEASAHASLSPRISAEGRLEVYQLVIFGERSIPTTEVELIVPNGIEIQKVEPIAGWTHSISRNPSGNSSMVVWKGSLGLGGQVELRFVAKTVGGERIYPFKALQRYADGEVAEWDYEGMWVKVGATSEPLVLPRAEYVGGGAALVIFSLGVIFARRQRRGKNKR